MDILGCNMCLALEIATTIVLIAAGFLGLFGIVVLIDAVF